MRWAAMVLVLACAAPASPQKPDRLHRLSDPDGDGIMTEEDCPAECLALANPDPACVYLDILETTFTLVDADGTVIDEEPTLCLTCLDADREVLYTDCGGTLPPGAIGG
jgi:hypothetical protein